MWVIARKKEGCPCSTLPGPPNVTLETLGRASEERELLAWTAHSWRPRMHIHTSLHPEYLWCPHYLPDSYLHCQHTGCAFFTITSNSSYKCFFKPKARAYASNSNREETNAGSHMSSKPAERPWKNLCQKWGKKYSQISSFFEILLWEPPWLIILWLFTPQNMRIHYRLILPNIVILCKYDH